MQEFIHLHKGDMSLKEYSINFTQLSKHAPTMVANSRAKMNKFVMGISDGVVNECRSSMLIPTMDISRIMVHVEQIEEKKLKQVGKELKRTSAKMEILPKTGFEVQEKQRFKKRFSNQGSSNTPRVNEVKGSIPKPQ